MTTIHPTIKAVKPGPSGAKSLRIAITNVHDGSDYSAQMLIGSNKVPANLILDTGSSTLAVEPKVYNPADDTDMTATSLMQIVTYGTGGWAGPVVNTTLTFGSGAGAVTLQTAPVAVAMNQEKGNFQGVDGILGLAFNALNTGYDLKSYLATTNPTKPFTWPWPFSGSGNFTKFLNRIRHLLSGNSLHSTDVEPYFTELESNGVVANKFAFYTKRSFVHLASTDMSAVAADPLNNGVFILGGGEEQTGLYSGAFLDVDVTDDLYYNTNLVAVQVGNQPQVNAQPLQAQYSFAGSNSIVDSGTSDLSLAKDVYDAIISGLSAENAAFAQLMANGVPAKGGIPMSELDLSKWPDIYFILTGINGGTVKLSCSPSTYWQVNFPQAGKAVFQISGPVGQANQSILGLPLMNNYYTIFDRSTDKNGIVRFAPIN